MKQTIMTVISLLFIITTASPMSYEQARREAFFLTDKMAFELNLTQEQYDAAYEINLDYLMGVTTVDDVFSTYWTRRNLDMSYILLQWQWDAFCAATYFYRPLYWANGFWHFAIYARYPRRNYFYFSRPTVYITYRGGHSWRSNGGKSYYHSRSDNFRRQAPNGGMRDKWNKGEFQGNRIGNNSSTHVTVNHGNNNNNFGNSKRKGTFSESRNNNTTRTQTQKGSFHIGNNSNNTKTPLHPRFGTSNKSASTKLQTGTTQNNTFGGTRNSGSFSKTKHSNTTSTNRGKSPTTNSTLPSPQSIRNGSFKSVRNSSPTIPRSSNNKRESSNNGGGFSGRR